MYSLPKSKARVEIFHQNEIQKASQALTTSHQSLLIFSLVSWFESNRRAH